MKITQWFIIVYLVFMLPFPSAAQKWGKVSKEILQMTSFPQDPEANAVVLFVIGDLKIDDDFNLIFKKHVRIKILTEEGKEYSDIRIPYYYKDKMDGLKAQTILPNGKKIKLKKKEVFEDKTRWYKYKVFAMPGVEVGSVIEYKYEVRSEHLTFLEPWQFQNREFTILSRISVTLQPGFKYKAFFTNITGLDPQPEVEEVMELGPPRRKINKYTWKMENIEAIRKEPYMTTLDDYMATMYFQLISYDSPYTHLEFISTWEDLAKTLNEHYSDFLKDDKGLKKRAAELCPQELSAENKMKALYEEVCQSVETKSSKWIYVDKKPHEVYEAKSGTAVEKNALLITLLRHAGFEAYPVFISTRDNGKFYSNHPQLQQFNHVIVAVNTDRGQIFMDTRDKYCPYGLLPSSDIVGGGFLVDENGGEIVKIPEPKILNMLNTITTASITDEGDLICHSVMRFEGYRAVRERKKLTSEDNREYIEGKLRDRFTDALLDSFKVTALDEYQMPLSVDVYFHVPGFIDMEEEMVYLMPPLMNRFESNPFKSEKRNFPVEYNYKISSAEKVEFSVPAGLKVVELPPAANLQFKGINYACVFSKEENNIICQRRYIRRRNTFRPKEYKSLRHFYSKLVSADESMVVLSKTEQQQASDIFQDN